MAQKVVLIHTLPLLINTFNDLSAQLLPGVEMLHILNEVLVEEVRMSGAVGERQKNWLRLHVASAQYIHASAVLVTCTILSACVDEVRAEFDIPIIRIDEEMAKSAVACGQRIGIIATNPDTIQLSAQLIVDYAAQVDKPVQVTTRLAGEAFAAVRNGELARHDQLVKQAVMDLSPNVDVVILAQASMARVLDLIPPAERRVPILSSPYLAIEQLRSILAAVQAA
jgi:Asp/Glu/hydantoin racemase